MASWPRFWNRCTIAAKLKLSFGVLFLLFALIMGTWFGSLELVKRSETEINLCREIESIVCDMDRKMEKAKRLHRDFFLNYARIGLTEAHVQYVQPSVRMASQAASVSTELQKKIQAAGVSHTFSRRNVDVNLYLSSAKRFADTSIESIEQITKLAAPEYGLEARFESLAATLAARAGSLSMKDQLQEITTYYLQYKVSRKRHIMQSAFNVIFMLRRDLAVPGLHDLADSGEVEAMLASLKQLGEEILDTDHIIQQLFNDFSLQVQNITHISQTLVDTAREEVERAQQKVVRTHRIATLLIAALTFLALLFGGIVSLAMHRSIAGRITALTSSTARLRRGHVDVSVAEDSADEVGQLARTFNMMAGRIKELVDGLESKVEERTRQLAESERRFRHIASELPNIAVMGFGPSRQVMFWNQACERLYGYAEAEAIGRRVEELLCGRDRKDQLAGRLANWIERGEAMPPSEDVFQDRQDRPVQVFVSYVLIEPAGSPREIYGIHIDLADLKKAQQESALRQSFYRNLFDHTGSGVVVLAAVDGGADFLIRDCNNSFARIERIAREDAIDRRVGELFPGPDSERAISLVRQVWQTGDPAHFGPVGSLDRNHSGWRQGHIYTIPTGEVVMVYDDITKEYEADLEHAAMEARLQRAGKMEALGLLAGGVAHDLNNILSGITGYPELLLLQLEQGSSLRKPLEAINASGQRAAAVVADLLTVARGIASERKICAINVLVREYLDSPEHKKLAANHPGIAWTTRLGEDAGQLACSAIHIRKSLMNLVINAAEAIAGAGKITVTTGRVTVFQDRAAVLGIEPGSYVVVEVADSGQGISRDDLDHIFEPFYTKKVMDRSGTGLGLTVVWNTVQDHSGGIAVDSSPRGTTFTLYFPAVADRSMTEAGEKHDDCPGGAGETVMVVDDEELQLDIADRMLRQLGYEVLTVPSGEQAVQLLKHTRVDLLVLDMLMEPGMNGRETYEKIIDLHPDQKALIVSGFSENSDVKRARSLGAGGFLQKPYALRELANAVRQILDGSLKN